MTETIKIYRKCERCSGDGVVTQYGQESQECPDCRGLGKMLFLTSDDLMNKLSDILDKVNDIKEKCDEIFEKVK